MIIASPQNDLPRARRRWLRFRLRTLFIVMTIAAVWLGFTMKRLRDQERAVARILELGGWVAYEHQLDVGGNMIPNAEPPGPQWLRRIFGPQWNVRLVRANLGAAGGSRATDQDLELLLDLPDLQSLNVSVSRAITDVGLRHVGRLKHLENLSLNDCVGITDEGLAHLSGLHRLQYLSLVRCKMNGSGLRHVKHLPIHHLSLNDTSVTDDNLASVAAMSELEYLLLQGTLISDRALMHVRGLRNLYDLDVSHTAVTDEGLTHLTSHSKLWDLRMLDTKVTDQGVEKLKQALPNLKHVRH